MGWSLLQSAGGNTASAASYGVTYSTANLTAGTKLIAAVTVYGTTTSTVKDGAGNSFTKIAAVGVDNSTAYGELSLWAMDTPAGDVGTKPTITATFAASGIAALVIQEVSGLAVGNTLAVMIDGPADTNYGFLPASTNGNATCGAYHSTVNNEYLVAVYGDIEDSTTTVANPTGAATYTLDASSQNATGNMNTVIAYGKSIDGAETASFGLTGTGGLGEHWATIIVAFSGVTLTNSFEGGTNGTTITTGNSGGTSGNAFDFATTTGTGTTDTFDNTHAAHGTLAGKQVHPASVAATVHFGWSTSMGAQGTIWFRAYLYHTANPTVNTRIWQTDNGSTLNASLYILTTGQLLFTNSAAATIFTSTASVPLNRWYRIEGFVTQSATVGQVELKLFSSNPDGTVPDEIDTSAATQNTASSSQTLYRFGDFAGATETSTWNLWYDDVAISNTGYIGPVSVPPNAYNLQRAWPGYPAPGIFVPGQLLKQTSTANYIAVGSLLQATSSTFTLVPANSGDFIFLEIIQDANNTVYPSNVSSSNCTWVQVGTTLLGSVNSWAANCWIGTVTSTSSATVTITWNGATPTGIRVGGQEFSSLSGVPPQLDIQGNLDSTGTNTWPSLTPAVPGELYVGYVLDSATATNGSTPGYVYEIDAESNGFAYNVNCSTSAQAPVWGDSTQKFGIAVLLKPASGTQYMQTLAASVAITGNVKRFISRVLAATLVALGIITRSIKRILSAFTITTGVSIRRIIRGLTSIVTITATATRKIGKIIIYWVAETFGSSFPAIPGFTNPGAASPGQPLNGGGSSSGGGLGVSASVSTNKFKMVLLNATLAATSSVFRQVRRPLTAAADVTSSTVRSIRRTLTASTVVYASAVKMRFLVLAANVLAAATVTRKVLHNLTAVTTIANSSTRVISRTIQGTFAVAGQTVRQVSRILSGTVTASASLKRIIARIIATSTIMSASVRRAFTKTFKTVISVAATCLAFSGNAITGALMIIIPGSCAKILKGTLNIVLPTLNSVIKGFLGTLSTFHITIPGLFTSLTGAVDLRIRLPKPTTKINAYIWRFIIGLQTPKMTINGKVGHTGEFNIDFGMCGGMMVSYTELKPRTSTAPVGGVRWISSSPVVRWRTKLGYVNWQTTSSRFSQSRLSTQYIHVGLSAMKNGVAYNPSADIVQFAFMTTPTQVPGVSDWNNGSWEISNNAIYHYMGICRVGPNGVRLGTGTYTVYMQVQDYPETVVFVVGTLSIT